jgi:hypothetical protein
MDLLNAKRNECLRLVRMSNRRVNEIRIGNNESSAHRDKKLEVCTELLKQGKHFVTEAIFVNGGRADILVLDDFRVIEILKSEKLESIEIKKELYPKGLRVEIIKI